MTPEQHAALQPGDLIRNRGSGSSYVVVGSNPTIAIRAIHASNPAEWERIHPPDELLATLRNPHNRELLLAGDGAAARQLLAFADRIHASRS